MHAAKLESSPRLQRTLEALRRHPEGLTTRELLLEANVCAVNSCIDELRHNGFTIDCTMEAKGRFRYRLIAPKPPEGNLF